MERRSHGAGQGAGTDRQLLIGAAGKAGRPVARSAAARVPATIAFVATALAAATSGLSIVRHPGRAQIAAKLAPVETIAIVPGEFTFRLPGEYLRNGRPVDAPTRTVRFRAGFEVMKYQVSAGDYGRCVADGACETPDGNAAGDTPPPNGCMTTRLA